MVLTLTEIKEIYENKEKYLNKKIKVSGWIDKVEESKGKVIVDLRFDLHNKKDCEKCEHGDSLVLPLVFKRNHFRGRGIRNPQVDLQVYDLWLESYIVVLGKLTSDNGILQLEAKELDELDNCKGAVENGNVLVKTIKAEILNRIW